MEPSLACRTVTAPRATELSSRPEAEKPTTCLGLPITLAQSLGSWMEMFGKLSIVGMGRLFE